MLEQFFIQPVTVDRIRASWIAEPIERYVGWLAEHGYAPRNVHRRIPMLVRFGAFTAGRGVRRLDDLPAHVDAFVDDWLQTHGGQLNQAARQKTAAVVRNAVEQMLRVALPNHVASRHP